MSTHVITMQKVTIIFHSCSMRGEGASKAIQALTNRPNPGRRKKKKNNNPGLHKINTCLHTSFIFLRLLHMRIKCTRSMSSLYLVSMVQSNKFAVIIMETLWFLWGVFLSLISRQREKWLVRERLFIAFIIKVINFMGDALRKT